jgi:hypothetical protein
MLGYINTLNASDANSLWQAERAKKMGISVYSKAALSATGGMKKGAKSTKRLNAEAYMRYVKVLYFGDDFVTKEGVDKVKTVSNCMKYFPYQINHKL